MNSNHRQAIKLDFENLDPIKRYNLLQLTQQICYFQYTNNLPLLNKLPNQYELDNLLLIPINQLNLNQCSNVLARVYKSPDSFREIIKLLTQIEPLHNLNSNIAVPSQDIQLLKFLNRVVLINLIQKRLQPKTLDEIEQYNLFSQLNEVNPNLILILGLFQLQYCDTPENIRKFWDTYNYRNIHFGVISLDLDDTKYSQIYQIFDKFI